MDRLSFDCRRCDGLSSRISALTTSIVSDTPLKIGALVMVSALKAPGRITGIVKDRREIRYSVRYRSGDTFRQADFTRGQLTLVVRNGSKKA